ncbi:MAG: tetraacyldisaccharide 4'-kinase [Mariprofundus sp.]|nr:tetraacyldisaccharide 4'-kinase [Mariprofundus sp.]
MFKPHQWVEAMWWQKKRPPLWLRMLEPIYATISHSQLKRRAAAAINPPLPMISVGNITVGGSGKTPFVLWLAAELAKKGYQPVILCRGDGGKSATPSVIDTSSNPNIIGDEACMMANISNMPVIAARDRVAGCNLAGTLGNIIILDDGFQYRHLTRCCDIILIPAEGVGNGHLIPAGPLREPLSALQRADLVIRTTNRPQPTTLPLWANKEYHWLAKAGKLIDIQHTGKSKPEQMIAVTAIARPQRFFDDLASQGVTILEKKTWPDHHRFSTNDVNRLLSFNQAIAVTAKDAIKLAPLWPAERPLWVLQQQGEGPPEIVETIIQVIKSQKNKIT